MNFEDKKFTRNEIIHAMRLCADGGPCERCEFFEAECPRGYNPCHEYMMLKQAADLLEERTAKVEHKSNTYVVTPPKSTTISYETRTSLWEECGNCHAMGMYRGWNYCPKCGVKLDWSGNE